MAFPPAEEGVPKVWSPRRPWRAALGRCALRQLREELPLLRARWRLLAACGVAQYLHGVAGQAAYYMHRPAPRLHDLGFELVPELGPAYFAVSEALTAAAFVTFALWVLSPFASAAPRFHATSALSRMLAVVAACQLCRMASFTVTQLPSPAPHCQPGTPAVPPPRHLSDWLVVDVARQVNRGCGDLIFSSHVTFVMTMALTYSHYGSRVALKALAWALVLLNAVVIIASRKHYTVDVVVAAFTVPLVWEAVAARLRDPPRPSASSSQLALLLPK